MCRDVRCIADAPNFLPPEVHPPECPRRQDDYQSAVRTFWGRWRHGPQGTPTLHPRENDHSCWDWASHPGNGITDPAEYCGLLTTALAHITTPIYILVSLFDPTIGQ